MQSGPHSVIRFGVFEVDLAAHELRKRGVRIRLQAQPFRVLAMLLERPGEVVAREKLQSELWSDNTFVEFDKNLRIWAKTTCSFCRRMPHWMNGER